ncbi:MAG: STAS domain-containing protein [Solirubrobacterales bacterium]
MKQSQIAVDSHGEVVIVTLHGEHDLHTSKELTQRLDEALASGAAVVDLTEAEFVDSSILGAIVNARRRAADADRGFAVALEGEGQPGVRRVLEVSGLSTALPVHPSVEAASSAARAQPDPV